jgi:hypothetical protein
MAPEVLSALKLWIKNAPDNFVLIGGLALSYYNIVRYTQDVDVLYTTNSQIPVEVIGFKHHRHHVFLHKTTHVEIETTSPELFTNISTKLVQQVFDTSILIDGIHIVSRSALVALKAQASRTGSKGAQDKADVLALLENGDIDITVFNISEEASELVLKLRKELE